jgi:hydrogenase nickel incorporation protein HypB
MPIRSPSKARRQYRSIPVGSATWDAVLLELGLNQLPLEDLNLVIVENVGNLICPASFKLGTHANVVVASIPRATISPISTPISTAAWMCS